MRLYPVLLVLPFAILVFAIAVYVYRRLSPIAETRARKIALGALLALGPLCLVLSRTFSQLGPASRAFAVACGFVGHGISLTMILFTAISLVRDALRFCAWLVRRVLRRREEPSALPEAEALAHDPALSRRAFIEKTAAWGTLALTSSTTAYGLLRGRVDRQIEEAVFRLPKLPSTREGYTIAQLSDVHFGQYVGERELREAFELALRTRPDLVVMTGDLIDHDPSYLHLLGELVRKLESRVRDGVVIIPGNHDYYTGIEDVERTVTRAGATMLRNRGLVIGEGRDAFSLLGVDDLWSVREGHEGANVVRALSGMPEDHARVLLCHNPAYFPEAAPHVDLMLSGHTHGGQIGFGGHPADLVLPFGYVRGRYTRGESMLYVNRGFGTAGPPARIGSPPEVTRIVLTG